MFSRAMAPLVCAIGVSACASLGPLAQVIQPPRFAEAREHGNEIRLLAPTPGQPLGGATLRVWARVTNPNPVGFTLSTLRAELSLEGTRAAVGEFPLGLPLTAGGESVFPLDLSVSFADLPGLADVVRRAASGQPLAYDVAGTVGIEAGALGRPTFGPMPLFRGELAVRR